MTRNTLIGTNVPFTRVARITGYLAKIERFNSAKRKEVEERTKHQCDIVSGGNQH